MNRHSEHQARWQDLLPDRDYQVLKDAGYGQVAPMGERAALLIVDVTHGFCGPRSMPTEMALQDQRHACGEPAWEAVTQIVELLHHVRQKNGLVIFSKMRDIVSTRSSINRSAEKNSRALEDRDNPIENEIVEELTPLPTEYVFEKDMPSLFFGTSVLPLLIKNRVDTVVISGGTTSGCIYATALDAFSNNLAVAVISDGTFDRVELPHWTFLMDIDMKYGNVMSSAEAKSLF